MRDFQSFLAGTVMLCCTGFSMCSGKSASKKTLWPASAAVAADQLRFEGLRCEEEGRELYPIVYVCSSPEDTRGGHVYLYADDGNELEGIRAFADQNDIDTFQSALRLVYSGRMPVSFNELEDPSWLNNLPDTWIIETGNVAEFVEGNVTEQNNSRAGLRYLRITPRNQVANK